MIPLHRIHEKIKIIHFHEYKCFQTLMMITLIPILSNIGTTTLLQYYSITLVSTLHTYSLFPMPETVNILVHFLVT